MPSIDTQQLMRTVEAEFGSEGGSWIRDSALTERAYWRGLLTALEFMQADSIQLEGPISKMLLGTLYARKRDLPHNPARSSKIGQLMEALRAELSKPDMARAAITSLGAEIKECLNAYRRTTDDLIKSSNEAIQVIENLISKADSTSQDRRSQMFGAFEHASKLGRILAQLDSG